MMEEKKYKKFIWWFLPLILLIGLFYWKNTPKPEEIKETDKERPIKRKTYQPGRLDACAKNPTFPKDEGLKPPYLIDLRQVEGPGIIIMEARKNGQRLKRKGWSKAGVLGPYTLDKNGTIYTAPIPFVSLKERPPSFYNRLYMLDGETGRMSRFMSVPNARKPTENNPYGIVGLAYDCSNHSIYIASLGGSDAQNEVGRIFHVDLRTKKILHVLEGFDALGIGLFTTKYGKKLYLGSARTPEVFAIQLSLSGDFVGDPSFAFSLAALEGGSSDRAHRIRFMNGNRMTVKGIEFSYSLMAASDPQRNIYMFDYDEATDSWKFDEVHPQ